MCPTCQLLPLNKTKIEARELLIRAAWLVLLGTQLHFLQGCSTTREHKWLFYDLQKENDVQYQGYTITTGAQEKTNYDGTVRAGTVRRSITELITPADIISLDKPTIDEDDQLHFVFFGPSNRLGPEKSLCKFTPTPYNQSHDSKMAPPYSKKPIADFAQQQYDALAQSRNAQADVNKFTQLVESNRLARQRLEQEVDLAQKRLKQDPTSIPRSRLVEKLREQVRKAEAELTVVEHQLLDARLILLQAEKQSIELASKAPTAFVCDLDVRELGGTKIVYALERIRNDETATKITMLEDTVLVHELYRFRVLAGPVFSTLQKRNKTYDLKSNSSGQNEVTVSAVTTSPANFALMLKTYLWAKRDVLNPPSLFSSRGYEMINPVIGINLLDNPLKNLYAGLSLELAGGFDIVGGVHWAKTQQLTGGFYEGQTTTQSNVATKERFSNGWFVGVTADIGIITTWLSNVGSGLTTAIKSPP